jgi:hypothetical protein
MLEQLKKNLGYYFLLRSKNNKTVFFTKTSLLLVIMAYLYRNLRYKLQLSGHEDIMAKGFRYTNGETSARDQLIGGWHSWQNVQAKVSRILFILQVKTNILIKN